MSLAQDLSSIPVFEGLPEEDYEWLAEHMTEIRLAPGEVGIEEGSPADRMFVVLEGEIRAVRSKPGFPAWVVRAPNLTGLLPYSRMTHFPATIRAVGETRVAAMRAEDFPEMLDRFPMLRPRLVSELADRIRRATQLQDQTEKLAALGKISAGLAHELNNPAAAVRRAASTLRDTFETFRVAAARLDAHLLTAEQRAAIPALERDLAKRAKPAAQMDSLERSDCEERIVACLTRHGVERAWELAPALVDAGCEASWFEDIMARFPEEALPDLLARVASSLTVDNLVSEIESAGTRIFDLVRVIKEYSYMDQAAEQEVDVHRGLENTLLMLKARWKHGVIVKLDFDRSLPKLCAHGSELNQVWTNLIDNAIDAMDGHGELTIRTAREQDRMLVEIRDTGSGIPPEIRDRLFEPFFTTKGVGKGTGLGLETAARIVREHGGEITVDSAPGDTRFQIRLPLAHSEAKV